MSRRMTIGSFCSGVGGLDLAVEEFFDAETAWFFEYDQAPSKVLAHRWPGVTNYGDMTAVDWTTIPRVDIACGGTPCQDLSGAGGRKGMTEGTRSNLWVQMREAIAVLKPSIVVWENVRGAYSACADSEADSKLGRCPRCLDPDSGADHAPNLRALGRVLGDLSSLGFDAEWVGVRASDFGAPHERFRVFVVAHSRRVFSGSRRNAASGEASRRRASADARGSGRVGTADALSFLPTPKASDGEWATPRTSGRPIEKSTHLSTITSLLPTPNASVSNDGETFATWEARRRTLVSKGVNGNGAGMPLTIATQLLPTPRRADPDASMGSPGAARHVASGNGSLAEVIGVHDFPKLDVVAEYERLWDSLEDQSPFWVTAEGKDYWPAISRWAEIMGRRSPAPTLPDGRDGRHRLAPRFTEWLMGWAEGWVTAPVIGLSRTQGLKVSGNGVVTLQALRAIEIAENRFEMVAA